MGKCRVVYLESDEFKAWRMTTEGMIPRDDGFMKLLKGKESMSTLRKIRHCYGREDAHVNYETRGQETYSFVLHTE